MKPHKQQSKTSTVLIPLAQGCEELEAVTIIDLLRRANITVVTASLDDKPVTCARKTVIIADTTLEQVINDDFDLMVLPGGLPGADNLNDDPRIHQLITRLSNEQKYIAAICAAPKVLASNGILEGKKATAYPGSLAALDTSNIQLSETPIEKDGRVITSRGPGTAMDFALSLIETLLGKEARNSVEKPLQRA
jgi:4-methyl-5(b-hydroxyethyl)-thiazole monophosphate biosynthesis